LLGFSQLLAARLGIHSPVGGAECAPRPVMALLTKILSGGADRARKTN